MTGYIYKFAENKITMSVMVKNKQLFKNYKKIQKKIERLISNNFNSETIYGDDDKYNKYIYIYIYIKLKFRHYNYKFS